MDLGESHCNGVVGGRGAKSEEECLVEVFEVERPRPMCSNSVVLCLIASYTDFTISNALAKKAFCPEILSSPAASLCDREAISTIISPISSRTK